MQQKNKEYNKAEHILRILYAHVWIYMFIHICLHLKINTRSGDFPEGIKLLHVENNEHTLCGDLTVVGCTLCYILQIIFWGFLEHSPSLFSFAWSLKKAARSEEPLKHGRLPWLYYNVSSSETMLHQAGCKTLTLHKEEQKAACTSTSNMWKDVMGNVCLSDVYTAEQRTHTRCNIRAVRHRCTSTVTLITNEIYHHMCEMCNTVIWKSCQCSCACVFAEWVTAQQVLIKP